MALAEALHEALVIGHLVGAWDASPAGRLAFAADPTDPFDLPFDAAVAYWQRKRPVPKAQFNKLNEMARQDAFTLAAVADVRLSRHIQDALGDAIQEGTGFQEFVTRVDEATDHAGRDSLAPDYLDTVFRTNLAQAEAAGRYEQLMASREDRPVWVYHAVDDERSRPTHAAMNGFRAPWDSPVWAEWFPPNGFRCRCTVTSETDEQAKESGYTEAPETAAHLPDGTVATVDTGFAGSPALADEARGVGARLRDVVERFELLKPTVMDVRRFAKGGKDALDKAYRERLRARARSLDPERLKTLRRAAGLDDAEVLDLLREVPVLNVFPEGAPEITEDAVEAWFYSQDVPSMEMLARRVVQDPRFTGLRAGVTARPRVTVFPGYADEWDPTPVVLDPGLGQRLGHAGPVAWSSEVGLVLRPTSPQQASELARDLANWLDEKARVHVPLAWDIPDVRLLGPHATQAPRRPADAMEAGDQPPALAQAWLNLRTTPSGRTVGTLSLDPLPGWSSRQVLINAKLADLLEAATP